jgi:hypothetical protein
VDVEVVDVEVAATLVDVLVVAATDVGADVGALVASTARPELEHDPSTSIDTAAAVIRRLRTLGVEITWPPSVGPDQSGPSRDARGDDHHRASCGAGTTRGKRHVQLLGWGIHTFGMLVERYADNHGESVVPPTL